MKLTNTFRLQTLLLLVALVIFMPAISSGAGLNDLLGKKEVDEEERRLRGEAATRGEQRIASRRPIENVWLRDGLMVNDGPCTGINDEAAYQSKWAQHGRVAVRSSTNF